MQVLLKGSVWQRRPSPLPPRQVAGCCSRAYTWLQLEKKLHSITPHASFRLFLTMEIKTQGKGLNLKLATRSIIIVCPRKLPTVFLAIGSSQPPAYTSRIFTFEPPPGMKANHYRVEISMSPSPRPSTLGGPSLHSISSSNIIISCTIHITFFVFTVYLVGPSTTRWVIIYNNYKYSRPSHIRTSFIRSPGLSEPRKVTLLGRDRHTHELNIR